MTKPTRIEPLSVVLSLSLVAIGGIVALQQTGLFAAVGTLPPVCGNGIKEGAEQCDLGYYNGAIGVSDCSTACAINRAGTTGSSSKGFQQSSNPPVSATVCGNGAKEGAEQCDLGIYNGPYGASDCSYTCQFNHAPNGGDQGGGNQSGGVTKPVCGNRVLESKEACDDGNKTAGDGCSASCKVEKGYDCSGSSCAKMCGNRQINVGETCDDGNTANGDGCNTSCKVEKGYDCSANGCTPKCGNGVKDSGEKCDDGNRTSGDGCSNMCAIETGYACTGTLCTPKPVCGNGIKEGTEQCDLGQYNGPADVSDCSKKCKFNH